MLFSATLSRDPAKIDALDLNNPIFVSVEDELDGKTAGDEGVDDELKFTLPATLRVCPLSLSPHALASDFDLIVAIGIHDNITINT